LGDQLPPQLFNKCEISIYGADIGGNGLWPIPHEETLILLGVRQVYQWRPVGGVLDEVVRKMVKNGNIKLADCGDCYDRRDYLGAV